MIVLDTHAWLWWMHEPDKLSQRARAAIEAGTANASAVVCSISVWEVAVKVKQGKLGLPMSVSAWFQAARRYPGIEIEALDPLDAIESTLLPGDLHRDPADRILIAVARRRGATLVTRDRRILSYPHVTTLW